MYFNVFTFEFSEIKFNFHSLNYYYYLKKEAKKKKKKVLTWPLTNFQLNPGLRALKLVLRWIIDF